MFNKYFRMISGLILLLLVYCISLLPLIVVRSHLEYEQFLVGLGIWTGCALLFLFPALGFIIRKSWFFPGSGEPVILDLLQAIIFEINTMNGPARVKKTRKELLVTWKFDEPPWAEKMDFDGIKKLYELALVFDNNTKTVLMTDRYRTLKWKLSGHKAKVGFLSLPQLCLGVETGTKWGIENYKHTDQDAYTYEPSEIKTPLLNTILKNGWNVRFQLL